MKEGADMHPTPPDDPHDPLLAALRERLGESFGQEPPAALWAGIRRQLPAAPRPWWRGRRRLLALLLGLVALGVFVGQPGGWLNRHFTARTVATSSAPAAGRPGGRAGSSAASSSATSPAPLAASAAATAAQPATRRAAPGSQPTALASKLVYNPSGQPTTSSSPATTSTSQLTKPVAASSQARLARRAVAQVAAAGAANHPQRGAGLRAPHSAAATSEYPGTLASAAARAATPVQRRHSAAASATGFRQRTRPAATAYAASNATRRALPPPTPSSAEGTPALESTRPATPSGHHTGQGEASEAITTTPAMAATAAAPPAALDSLAVRRAALLLATRSLPAVLSPAADSNRQWLPPVRRWSVLVLAGPTLSYRTLRAANTGGLAYSTPAATSPLTNYASNGSATDRVALERPAVGLGAQVQVRRVLSGRWALAVGAGYQEYATRLALQVTTRRSYAPSTGSAGYTDSTSSVHHRDTYRLLTLPVQLSYALGPPHGRWSLGLLGGLEPGWYVGGRTTEGSSCDCEQQTFGSASGSPYNLLSLSLSLGLDARYRLGGPASRWQWVLQPTGRYVASPFVRSSSLYARRQPYSLGLLMGLAWDF